MQHPHTEDWSRCEAQIRAFEEAWQADGTHPRLEDFLVDDPVDGPRLLVELAHVDIELRRRRGLAMPLEEYLQRFPALNEPQTLLDLIATERRARRRQGEAPTAAEYRARFPQLALRLVDSSNDSGDNALTSALGSRAPHQLMGVLPEIPGFEVRREVGHGGMGAVYEAWQPSLQRTVAIKTLAGLPRRESAARFRREAEAMARLDHPHIVPVYEVGDASLGNRALPYLVMKWCGGGSLADQPARSDADPASVARLVETVAAAVQHAHERGLLHRDIKPSNILLDEAGQPHVADFGLAGWFDPQNPRSLTTEIVGTPAYMAPEQARAPSQVTTAADIYGLGALLYYLLTGKPPHQGETALDTLERAGAGGTRPPSQVNHRVPTDLDAICLKCLSPEPRDRYSSAAALADDLQRWRTGQPIAARPVPWWERQRRFIRRQPVLAGMGAVAALALLAMMLTLTISYQRVRQSERDLAEALGRERRQLYAERMASAARLYLMNQLPAAWNLLDQTDPELRGWEYRYLHGLRAAPARELRGHADWVQASAFLPDGRLVTGDRSGQLIAWDVAAGREVKRWRVWSAPIRRLAAHPRQPWVAIEDETQTSVWDVEAGKRLWVFASGRWPAFSPNGQRLAVAKDSEVHLLDAASGAPRSKLSKLRASVYSLAFLSDDELAVGDADAGLSIWELGQDKLVAERKLANPAIALASLGEPPQLVQAISGEVQCVEPRTGALAARLGGELAYRIAIAVEPASRLVAVNGLNGEVLLWSQRDQRQQRTLRGHAALVTTLAFSPDGRVLATGGGDLVIRLWDLRSDTECWTFGEFDAGWSCMRLAPDGSSLVVVPRYPKDGVQAVVMDPQLGTVLRKLPALGAATYVGMGGRLALTQADGTIRLFDPDGREIGHLTGATGPLTSLTCPATGPYLIASDTKGKLHLWDTEQMRYVGAFPVATGTIYGLAPAPTGSLVAVAARDTIVLWDAQTQSVVPWETRPGGALAVAWHPSGSWLASADRDRIIRFRDARTGNEFRKLLGSSQPVMCMTFSPDGTRLVSAGHAAPVRLWDVETGVILMSLPAAGLDTFSLVWDPGRDAIIALDDHVRTWPRPTAGK